MALEVDLAPVTVSADPVLLARLVGNLVHNAIKHDHRGGRVLIREHLRRDAFGARSPPLTGRNTGPFFRPGVPVVEHVERARTLRGAGQRAC
ncbi:hypothetical protein [Actinomadura alba]|uniref:Uncharacterized protein n=1 Tax=Actinomadura alba TaxID=406431 RepID=A0ABR7LPU7_9ACTN|nr:hypothetical protein [Actinomadura alba]MBC6466698.1 hypothetical protein [Actinomadura alba]